MEIRRQVVLWGVNRVKLSLLLGRVNPPQTTTGGVDPPQAQSGHYYYRMGGSPPFSSFLFKLKVLLCVVKRSLLYTSHFQKCKF